MILSDRDLKVELESGRVVVEPLGPNAIQPSSIDLRIGRHFRVFANTRYPYIDVRKPMEDLTELVEVTGDEPFILHPGEFVLGTTLERVAIPDDLVGRLEGKSSLGRLGLLIHSSLPASEEVLFLDDDGKLGWRTIGDIVGKSMTGWVVSFDPATFAVGYHRLTGWYEGPPDTIFEVRLASGRRVRVTAGHNLFTLNRSGDLKKVRTGELQTGVMVAVPRRIPDPALKPPIIDVLETIPEHLWPILTAEGEPVRRLFDEQPTLARDLLEGLSIKHAGYYSKRAKLPMLAVAQVPKLFFEVRRQGRLTVKGARTALPAVLLVTEDLAWLWGFYLAKGSARSNQVTFSNTDQRILDRVESILRGLGLSISRNANGVTACSGIFSLLVRHYGFGARARWKRVPRGVFGWPAELLQAFLRGFADGDGSEEDTRVSLWTSSEMLAGDLIVLAARLGFRSAAYPRVRQGRLSFQVGLPKFEHKLLSTIPLPDRLLVALRTDLGLTQVAAAHQVGFKHATDLCNLENRSGRDAVRRVTLERLAAAYERRGQSSDGRKLTRLIEGDLAWDRVVEVVRCDPEPIFDISVRPNGARIENFLAGRGGVFVSNTAGFVDAGFAGNLTLELSNVANLPITLYPGMKIGQISLFRMSSPAERPYGSDRLGSKYLDQVGPTPSRYWENFEVPAEVPPDGPSSK